MVYYVGWILPIAMVGETAFAEDESTSRPNVVFCMADDWSWPHAGVLGDPVVKTPAFDRVANEGVTF